MTHPESFPVVSPSASGLAGCWRLASRQALSLHPRAHRELRIAQGRVWVTTGRFHGVGGWPESGDMVLHAGDVLRVPAGAHLVLEDWPEADRVPVRFDFAEPFPPLGVPAVTTRTRLRDEVGQPARELAVALGQAAHALVRLVVGLAGCVDILAPGRGRVLSPLEGGAPP